MRMLEGGCPQSRLRPTLDRGRALQRSGLLIMRGLMGVATYGACVYDTMLRRSWNLCNRVPLVNRARPGLLSSTN
jgi:hypothetical protein